MSPYERAWRRAEATDKPAIYFQNGMWHAAASIACTSATAWRLTCEWVYGR
jgi:hypothetical protein